MEDTNSNRLTHERGQLCDPLPLGERLLGDEGEVHGGDDAGRRADPQDVLARQQRRDAQARRLVLADYVVAPCKQPECTTAWGEPRYTKEHRLWLTREDLVDDSGHLHLRYALPTHHVEGAHLRRALAHDPVNFVHIQI